MFGKTKDKSFIGANIEPESADMLILTCALQNKSKNEVIETIMHLHFQFTSVDELIDKLMKKVRAEMRKERLTRNNKKKFIKEAIQMVKDLKLSEDTTDQIIEAIRELA